MEDYEKMRLTKSNIIMILITIVMVILLIVATVLLIISLKKPKDGLPKLNVTSGRYTTGETTLTTASTVTTTTKTVVDASPYYEVNADNLYSDALYSKRDSLTRDEVIKIGTDYLNFANALYDITDYSMFNLKAIEDNVKDGELDLITKNGIKYGEIYNFDKLLDKMFITQIKGNVTAYYYKGKNVIISENGKYYRALNFVGNSEIKIVDISLENYSQYQISMKFTYYNTNYRELGYSSPNYTNASILLKYDDRWKIANYNFPLYE